MKGMEARIDAGQILERTTVGNRIAAELKRTIQTGDLPPGTRLLQTEIGRRFGVSNTPVREALALLQAEGIIKMHPHRGAIVHGASLEEMRENYRILETLETMAVAEAIPLLSKPDLEKLQSLINVMRITRSDLRWVELNDAFHLTLDRASGMNQLCDIIEKIRVSCKVYFRMYVASRPPESRSDDEHQAILDACKAKDIRNAKKLTKRHVRDAMRELEQLLRKGSQTDIAP